MAKSITRFSKLTTVVGIALFGSFFGVVPNARAADGTPCENGPMVKNLMAMTKRPCQAAEAHELTRREIKKLAASAESVEDHLKLARYFNAQANRLEASAAGYEEAAARYHNGPMVKNLTSPTTPGRYAFIAKGFREEAKSNRALAASHEQMGKNAVAGL